jgi:hypothetical protein
LVRRCLYLGKEVGPIAAEYFYIVDIHIGGDGQPQNRDDFAARRFLACRIFYYLNELEVKV